MSNAQQKTCKGTEIREQLDIHIGNMIKRLRLKNDVSQVSLSKGLDVSVTQIQKYENSTNKVSASRLFCLAILLKTSPAHFFDSFVSKTDIHTGLSDNEQDGFSMDISKEEEKEQLINAYFSIEDPVRRKWHLDHIKQYSSHQLNTLN